MIKLSDQVRALLIATIQSLFPVLNLLGIINMTGDETSVLMLFINNLVTMAFLVFKAKPSVVAAILAPLGAALVLGAATSSPVEAYQCGTTYQLRIEITDLDGERIETGGAEVTIRSDPQDGLGSRVYQDNGINDDSGVTGRILESTACATGESDRYSLELTFQDNGCQPQTDTLSIVLNADTVVTFKVHDCERATRTPRPQPTQTPVVVTATPTASPVPTNAPLLVQCADGSLAVLGQCPKVSTVTPVPVVPTSVPTQSIRPPSTGDAGLVQ